MADSRVINFGAGPSALPLSILEETAQGLVNFNGTGIGIAEISHRSKEFLAFLSNLESLIREQLVVPPTHSILFTQGGGTGQFSAIVLNLLARHTLIHPDATQRNLDYVVTGSWSKKAMEEAKRLGGGNVNVVVDGRPYSSDYKSFDNIPAHETYSFSENPALIYYCDNETVDGVQFSHDTSSPSSFPYYLLPKDKLVPLVADYSSSFMSRPIPNLADHAVIYAGAQKNIGPAGVTVLIVRQDCIVDVDAAAKLGAASVPITMSYKTIAEAKSVYNTPSVLALYMTGLVVQRMKDQGGMKYYEALNKRKSDKIYATLDEGVEKGIFKRKVKNGSGSWMNIVFDVLGDGREALFLSGAEERGMKSLKGHRSVGGIRVSLYNAITEEQTNVLVSYMKDFIAKHAAPSGEMDVAS